MNDPLLVGRLERLANLLPDGQCLIERDCSSRNPLRQILPLDEFHHQRTDAAGFLETVDVGDIRMVQRGKGLRFACEPGEPVRVVGERLREDFQRDIAIELVSRAR